MKRLVAAALIGLMIVSTAPAVFAADEADPYETIETDRYEDAFSHPLRLAYYFIYPIGFTAEWLIMRPLHYIVSRPYLNRFFGYTEIGEEGMYTRMGERM